MVKKVEKSPSALVEREVFEAFGPAVLGLGDLAEDAKSLDAVAVVFDLEGFTNFCKQIDPHLSIPMFLSRFLEWLMNKLKSELRVSLDEGDYRLWAPLPFFVKFLGDGLLLLWNSGVMGPLNRLNLIVLSNMLRTKYISEFLPSITDKVADAPPKLRCGIARGTVYTVGNGSDYVGSCINMAARLQKLPGVSIAINRRGFDLEEVSRDHILPGVLVKRVAIRGIGENELVCIWKNEFEAMSDEDRQVFKSCGTGV